ARRSQELAGVVEVWAGYRGERGHLAHHRLVSDRGPGLNRTPVMRQQMHAADTQAVDDRADVRNQLREAVTRPLRRALGLTGAPHVVGNKVIFGVALLA